MNSVTVLKQGNSIGISLPEEIRIRMGIEIGQELTLIELTDGIKLLNTTRSLSGNWQRLVKCFANGPTR